MTDYDFSTLNDKEFEDLSIALISKDKGKRFERFKAGRDGGIDGRYYCDDGSQEIIQCKHYLKTGYKGLINKLKSEEVAKVKKLHPSNYIFVTSLPLSDTNKQEIQKLFDPYIKSPDDVYGQEALNDILSNNQDIEKRYYKLWLSNGDVLDRIFNNAIESRSEYLLEDIQEKIKYYVETENHFKALEKLEQSHIIIIAGEPGIGKTTLANHLALWYIEKEFKFYDIENSINEAESIYKRDEKQIFYFDDFLGSNYLEAIENKKDSHIVKFISRIKQDKDKRFILTSRTNIFNQGLALSDTFRSKNLENDEFIIKIDALKNIDRAKILYNHIWHSALNDEYIDEIYLDKRYLQIINHKNFNPRLVEFITDIHKVELQKVEANEYWQYIIAKLDNPEDIWKNTFDKQSDEFMRIIVMLVVFNGNKIEEQELFIAYNRYIELSGVQNDSNKAKEFYSIIEEVVKYFLNRSHHDNQKIEYTLFNPSIADFVLNRYEKNLNILKLIYFSLMSFQSLKELYSLGKRINKKIYENIVLFLYEKIDLKTCNDDDYLIQLLYMVEFINIARNDISVQKRNIFFQNIINEARDFDLIDEFVSVITYIDREELEIDNYDFIFIIIKNAILDENDINKIIELIKYVEVDSEAINIKLNQLITKYLQENLYNNVDDLTLNDIWEESSFNDGGVDFEYGLQTYISNTLDDLMSDIDNYKNINVDIVSIKNTIDIHTTCEKLIDDDINSSQISDYSKECFNSKLDDIDDLFQRQ